MTTLYNLDDATAFLSALWDPARGRIAALTGAGISTESGIPDFRSPGGIWSTRQPVQYDDFVRSEDSRMEDWQRRYEMAGIFAQARPNAAHRALADLVLKRRMDLLITQNVDGLHQQSGVADENLVELHGNSTYATCLDCGQRAELEPLRSIVESGQSPRCAACGGLLKAAVVSFGQAMPETEMQRAAQAAASCDVFLVLGSSLVVYPAAELPVLAVRAGAELVILNREPTPIDSLASTLIRTPSAESFEKLLP